MWAKITIKNYRCFPDSSPLIFDLKPGISAFVGVNNSGKSSILKFFYEFRELWGALSDMGTVVGAIRRPVGTSITGVADAREIFYDGNNRNITITFEPFYSVEETASGLVIERFEIELSPESLGFAVGIWLNGSKVPFDAKIGADNNLPGHLMVNGNSAGKWQPLFEFFQRLRQMYYIGPFRNASNLSGDIPYFDLTVAKSFIEKWESYQTGQEKRKNDLIRNIVENIRKIFGYEMLDIHASYDRQSFQIVANGKSYKLPEIGSGLTQFIVVLGNIAMALPSFILIDEPELNLHPSLQLDFLTTLASFSRGNLLFATHALGLARASADRIYSLSRQEGTTRITRFEATANLSEFLGELSYGGYSALGFNKLLLLEGVNDVKTIQQFLRQIKKDHEIVLLPLGGSAFLGCDRELELAEICRITGDARRIFSLIDSEKDSAIAILTPDRQRFVDSCKKLGINIHVLERRAIENYISEHAVKEVFGPKFKALEPFEDPANTEWGKKHSWLAARQMDFSEIEPTDLGQFLKHV